MKEKDRKKGGLLKNKTNSNLKSLKNSCPKNIKSLSDSSSNKKPGSKKEISKKVNPNKKIYKQKPKSRASARRSHRLRKIRIAFLYTLIAISIVGAGIALSVTILFKINNIEVLGQTHYSSHAIMTQSGIVKGENLFLCDTKSAANKIKIELPYIEEVDIKKSIPAKIEISVKESRPAGMVQTDNNYAIINADSKVLEITDQIVTDLPVLKGITAEAVSLGEQISYKDPDAFRIIKDISTAATENDLNNITNIDLTDKFNIKVTYDGRIVIILGQPVDIKYKMNVSKNVLSDPYIVTASKGELNVSLSRDSNKTYFKPYYS